MKKNLLFLFLAVSVGIAILYFVKGPQKNERVKVRIGFTNETLESLTLLAQSEGFFQKQGIDVELRQYSIGKEALEKGLLGGDIDIAPSAVTPAVLNFLEGKPIRIFTSIGYADDQMQILARKSSGITKVQDLKGKRIATQKAAAAHYYLDLVLQKYAISPSERKIVFAKDVKELPVMLENKTVDAICIKEPFISQAKERIGEDFVVFQEERLMYKIFNFVTTEQYIQKNSNTIERVLRALLEAETFVNTNPQQARLIIEKSGKIDIKQLDSQWSTTTFQLALDEALQNNIIDQGAWIKENKLSSTTSNNPNLLHLIYSPGLKKVKPQSVFIQ